MLDHLHLREVCQGSMEEYEKTYEKMMDSYVKLSKEDKQKEIVEKVRELIANIIELSNDEDEEPDLLLNKEILDLNKEPVTDDDYLEAIYAYLNCYEDLLAKYLEKIII